ncbi:Imm59 family immunity protein [Streptococcus dentiloxodontae]
MSDTNEYKKQLHKQLEAKNYLSLRFSLFEKAKEDYAVVIDRASNQKGFEVYATQERTSAGLKHFYDDFGEASQKFMSLLDEVAAQNRYYAHSGWETDYDSDLW